MEVGVVNARSGLSAPDWAMLKKEGLFAVCQTVERAHLFPLGAYLLQQFRRGGTEATLVRRRDQEEVAIGEWSNIRRQVQMVVAPYDGSRRELSYFAIESKAIFRTQEARTRGVVPASIAAE
jgi:hypothetical protein